MTMTLADAHAREVRSGDRFTFGDNWARFLEVLDEERIAAAEHSLRTMLEVDHLRGVRFLDAGSGSGLFSLAARRLGATVLSFDYDPSSVACTEELRRRFAAADDAWTVLHGSVLDADFLGSLGRFDLVYSWGVLHHTGSMWPALSNLFPAVAPEGRLFVALYNDQGSWSHRWRRIKRLYCSGPVARAAVSAALIPSFVVRDLAADLVWRRNPLARYRDYRRQRGMSVWHDWHDWLGGYPFEVARPEAVVRFARERGFVLDALSTCGGSVGCNEFVFRRGAHAAATPEAG